MAGRATVLKCRVLNLGIIPAVPDTAVLLILHAGICACRDLCGAFGKLLTIKGPTVQGVYRGFALRKIKSSLFPGRAATVTVNYTCKPLRFVSLQ